MLVPNSTAECVEEPEVRMILATVREEKKYNIWPLPEKNPMKSAHAYGIEISFNNFSGNLHWKKMLPCKNYILYFG